MSNLFERLNALTPQQLRAMGRGVEKESLRTTPDGKLALTPHPFALGSALTHPRITTDFCESQVELITGVHGDAGACVREMTDVHRFTYRVLAELGNEMLWASSMPCGLPADQDIPIGRFGSSNVGLAKSVYRTGLAHRYGHRMQTISGIHYNWSLPGVTSEGYFGLIRNFRRNAFLLLTLFGASPAVCSTFVAGREHRLQPLGEGSLYLPHATSLRMGRLGYQSDAQSSLAVSYNDLEGYGASLQSALTTPYPEYERLGIRDQHGEYNQLATSLLQIENEFYGTIRPKRSIRPGERPLHALRDRGVEYVEVRCMDLDPFQPVGIGEETMRFLDVFLLHCLLSDSPPDSPGEIADLQQNQHLAAARGRESGLSLQRFGEPVELAMWGQEILASCATIAARLDELLKPAEGATHAHAVSEATRRLADPAALPSARVLHAVTEQHGRSFVKFIRAQSLEIRSAMLNDPLTPAGIAAFEAQSAASRMAQQALEDSDVMDFETYRAQYVSPDQLVPEQRALANPQ